MTYRSTYIGSMHKQSLQETTGATPFIPCPMDLIACMSPCHDWCLQEQYACLSTTGRARLADRRSMAVRYCRMRS